MTKLILSIRSLDIGGAERQFIELVKNIDKSKFDVTVCTMYGGAQEENVKNIPHVRYVNLQKKGKYDFYSFYKNYSKILKESSPDVIYSFLGEMNLFSLWCKSKNVKLIWGFRSSGKDWSHYPKVDRIIFWLQKKLSPRVNKIISNSYASIRYHKRHGFDMQNAVVIHNGIDSNTFKRNAQTRKVFRKQYHIKHNDIVIGMVARIDPVKGYDIFVKVAKKILDKYDNIYFFSVGGGSEMIQKACKSILADNERFVWLGNQKNIEVCYGGLDIAVSASFAEGFSNSIAEAMSCSLPCVVTDVGDSALIVDDLGIVVEAKSVESLYNGLVKMMDKEYKVLGAKSRERVLENFSIEKMVKKTEEEIIECVG